MRIPALFLPATWHIFQPKFDKGDIREFLSIATQLFSYINIQLNPTAKVIADDFGFEKRKNLLLSLKSKVTSLSKHHIPKPSPEYFKSN